MPALSRHAFLNHTAALGLLAACAPLQRRGIKERGYVRIGGIDQWIAIGGSDVRNPAIVYLHGGPAEAQSPFLDQFAPWERDYTVVNWDQRGSGKTFERNGKATPDVTLERIALDAIEVAQYAAQRLRRKNVILVAQSWGCIVGLHSVLQRPEAFAVYVGTGQPVFWDLSLAERERYARSRMIAAHNMAAVKALDAAASLPTTDLKRLRASFKWRWAPADFTYLNREGAFLGPSPEKAKGDAGAWVAGADFSGPKLWKASTTFDARRLPQKYALPVFVIQGRDDHISSNRAAEAFVNSIQAPAKRYVEIDGGHFACLTDPSEFLAAMNRYVRPAALA